MRIKKVFMFLFFLTILTFLTLSAFAVGNPNLSAHFNSNGDLINGWYWLRDTSLQNYSQWIFERIPSGEYDLVLDITALATDRPNGRKSLPAEFYPIYENLGGNVLVSQKVTLPNISPPNDPVGYTCHGQVSIPRVIMQDSTVLLVRIERISSEDNHIAFHAESMAIIRAMETENQNMVSQGYTASKFNSNGSLISSWYWLRDSALSHYAEWTFEDIPAGNSDLVLDITALATDKISGGRGFDAHFLLIYGFPGSGNMGGVFQTKEITLSNVSSDNDPVGYTCHGLITIPRNFIAGATTFFFRVERINSNDNHVAFNQNSIVLFTDESEVVFQESQRRK